MMEKAGNLFAGLPGRLPEEVFERLAGNEGVTIERIVSTGQTTPAGDWLVGERHEWVALLSGAARLLFEGEAAARPLAPGDWLMIPAGTRHRVEWTAEDRTTVWLAVHYR
jgi:cupin 2 domain-containing protein